MQSKKERLQRLEEADELAQWMIEIAAISYIPWYVPKRWLNPFLQNITRRAYWAMFIQ